MILYVPLPLAIGHIMHSQSAVAIHPRRHTQRLTAAIAMIFPVSLRMYCPTESVSKRCYQLRHTMFDAACRDHSYHITHKSIHTLIARFMGPIWGPSGAVRAQVGPMLAPWTLLSGYLMYFIYTKFLDYPCFDNDDICTFDTTFHWYDM